MILRIIAWWFGIAFLLACVRILYVVIRNKMKGYDAPMVAVKSFFEAKYPAEQWVDTVFRQDKGESLTFAVLSRTKGVTSKGGAHVYYFSIEKESMSIEEIEVERGDPSWISGGK